MEVIQIRFLVRTKLIDWDLVDSGKHLDWDGNSQYISNFTAGVNKWNNYKPGVIRKDTASTITDVTISDYYKIEDAVAVTYSNGYIKFNKFNMDKLDSTKKTSTAIHEIGHALGVGHNRITDIMSADSFWQDSLSANDKASYDAAYRRY